MTVFRPGNQPRFASGPQVWRRPQAASGVVGVLDGISNVAAAYGLRQLRSAYSGSAVRVRRSSDSTEQDIGFDGSGEFDSASFSSFVGGGTGYVKTLYDQSGNGRNATQATTGSQPQIEASSINGKYAIASSSKWLQATFTYNQPEQIFFVVKPDTAANTSVYLDGTTITNLYFNKTSTSPFQMGVYAGNAYVTPYSLTNGTATILGALVNGASSKIWQDGAQVGTGNAGGQDAGGITIGARADGANSSILRYAELILFSASVSTTDHNTIGNNMATRYGMSWTTVT